MYNTEFARCKFHFQFRLNNTWPARRKSKFHLNSKYCYKNWSTRHYLYIFFMANHRIWRYVFEAMIPKTDCSPYSYGPLASIIPEWPSEYSQVCGSQIDTRRRVRRARKHSDHRRAAKTRWLFLFFCIARDGVIHHLIFHYSMVMTHVSATRISLLNETTTRRITRSERQVRPVFGTLLGNLWKDRPSNCVRRSIMPTTYGGRQLGKKYHANALTLCRCEI